MSESTCRVIGPIHLDETPPDGAPCERPRHAVPRRTGAHESPGTRHHGETILNYSVPGIKHLYLPLHNTLNSGPAGGTGGRVPCPSSFLEEWSPRACSDRILTGHDNRKPLRAHPQSGRNGKRRGRHLGLRRSELE